MATHQTRANLWRIMKVKGIFTEKDNRNGKTFVVVSKYWPDGDRFRRRCPNRTVANNLIARINAAVAEGRWKELRKELVRPEKDYTIAEFSEVYLEQYCRQRNTRPDFKEETLKSINEIVGSIKLRDFSRSDALHFETVRSKKVAPGTVNRGLAVLSNMLTFAFKKELITTHPMVLYGRLPEDEKERRFMTVQEKETLVQAVWSVDPTVGAYVAILSETGLRMEEGLNVKWEHFDKANQNLTVAASKNYKLRHVPLSNYALEVFEGIPHVIGSPFVFTRPSTGRQVRSPKESLIIARAAIGMTWVKGFHDFRHFRASQWVKSGIDLRTVQGLLGHRDVNTTMIYAHFDPKHAHKAVLEASKSA